MKFTAISIFPEMFMALSAYGVSARACDRGIVEINVINPRDFSNNNYRRIDDRPFGGGPGMLMQYEPLAKSIEMAKKALSKNVKVVYLSPQGRPLTQDKVKAFAKEDDLILLCGRYEGIDERLIESHVDEDISMGDYVLSGGELPAMVLMDSIIRLLPGVLNHAESAVEDSFYDHLLDCPHYTRPEILEDGRRVPEVLLSGDHKRIASWRHQQKLIRTYQRRKDLLTCLCLSDKDKKWLDEMTDETDGRIK
ncbi:MAG: tRNA (guanosine(37)-N1)-methyltransferase TrmD [Francisellaceae bacterium]